MSKIFCYFILVICGAVGAVLMFSHYHERIPLGCDEFGYLNLSRAFEENQMFQLRPEKSYLPGLIDSLRKDSIPDLDFAWMVAPHAHHIIPGTKKLINQYAPGTSMLMLISNIEWRQISFPAIAMALFILLIMTLAWKQIRNRVTWFDFYLPTLCLVMVFFYPLRGAFQWVNSLVPTFGLLFGAGMLLHSRPLLATFLIALTVNFRIVNGLMLLPVFLYLPFQWPWTKNNLYSNAVLMTKYALLIILAALPLFWYNYNLAGNPFFITHSLKDQETSSLTGMWENVRFYISPGQNWFIVNVVALITAIILQRYSKSKRRSLWLLTFLIINYAFFMIHRVKISYYPYAPCILYLGVIGGILLDIEFKDINAAKTFILLTSLVFLLKGSIIYIHQSPHQNFKEYKSKFLDLCSYDIVWCDEYSGPAEYTCRNNGFRYTWGTYKARKVAFEYCKYHQLKQAILLFDTPMDRSKLISEIESFGLTYQIKKESPLGEILEIQ